MIFTSKFPEFQEPNQYAAEEGIQRSKVKAAVQEEKPQTQTETTEKKQEDANRKPFGFTRAGAG